jgi:hypothetical protein
MSCREWCKDSQMEPVLPNCLGGYNKAGRVSYSGLVLGQGMDCTTVLGEGNGDVICFCAP